MRHPQITTLERRVDHPGAGEIIRPARGGASLYWTHSGVLCPSNTFQNIASIAKLEFNDMLRYTAHNEFLGNVPHFLSKV